MAARQQVLLLLLLVAVIAGEGVHLQLDRLSDNYSTEDQGRQLSSHSVGIDLTNVDDLYFYTKIGFGKDRKGDIVWVPTLVDTGSPWVWVQNSESDSDSLDPDSKVDTDSIPSFSENGMSETISYRGGTAVGIMGYVDLYFDSKTEVAAQTVLTVSSFQDFPTLKEVGGILGIGPLYAAKGFETLVDTMYTSKTIPDYKFTLSLGGGSKGKTGSLTLGDISTTDVKSGKSMKSISMNGDYPYDTHYTFDLDTITMGSLTAFYDQKASIDSGNPFIGLPAQQWWHFVVNEVPDDNCQLQGTPPTIMCDCSKISDFPDLTIKLAGITWTFEPKNYIVQTNSNKSYSCQVGIVQNTDGFDRVSLGVLFLRNTVVGVDVGSSSISFGANKHGIQPSNYGESAAHLMLSFVSIFVVIIGMF